MLKKIVLAILSIIICCFSCGCEDAKDFLGVIIADEEAEESMQAIANALEQNDLEALRSVYADVVFVEVDDFDISATDIMTQFCNKEIQIVEGGAGHESERFGEGSYHFFDASYIVNIDGENYIIDFWQCAKYEARPDMLGVHSVVITKEADKLAYSDDYYTFRYSNVREKMGIFLFEPPSE